MTLYQYHLSEFPNGNTLFPFHIDLHTISTTFHTHRHDFLECAYVVSGHGVEEVNGHSFTLEPGTVTFIRPFDTHSIYCDTPSDPLMIYNINFRSELFTSWELASSSLYPLFYERERWPQSHVQLTMDQKKIATMLSEEMLRLYENHETHRHVLLQAKLGELLLLFFEAAKETPPPPTKHERSADIWEVMDYLHAHFRLPLQQKALAGKFHMSASQLSEKMNAISGKSFTDNLHELRIRYACSLLFSTRMPIGDIAEACGFNSFKTFSRVFKDQMGETPSAFRNQAHHASPTP
ncbi:AraC family transcriptional regulator [Aureibacillus halotolerans]|uniref:AraC family transcriptional regulator n=1 Tax=Aureibacillus halotolerans TaxID=1508390 RepID=A0A4R6TW08_9BACI|nr:AraC family transcriptional regulator [Aureibacillus halotolerans]TDQ36423.1 AraC family transcriptional regulator [Aureibacillus halotolerans]